MAEHPPLDLPDIKNDHIRRACRLLDLPETAFHGEDGSDPRAGVLKCMDTIDVSACPGSGKTTLLVAKLAILAQLWPYETRGLCVVSHTKAARTEIETRLAHTTIGQRLLSYPHFIGTIHRFVGAHLASPWLRSRGWPVQSIDDGIACRWRWDRLGPEWQKWFTERRMGPSALKVHSTAFALNLPKLDQTTQTYRRCQTVCRESTERGYICYDEVFLWARHLMGKFPGVVRALRYRFPLLFIDEAQDNSDDQSDVLGAIFTEGQAPIRRQRFGDANQAIYGYTTIGDTQTDPFPNEGVAVEDIPDSHRFGPRIARLAQPLGAKPQNLNGQGATEPLASGVHEGEHTIFLFEDGQVQQVLRAYGGLLLATFSDEELRKRDFVAVAVGQVHSPSEQEKPEHRPRRVGHYWPEYDPEASRQQPAPRCLPHHITVGQAKAEASGETYDCVELIASGLLRLIDMVGGRPAPSSRSGKHRHLCECLKAAPEAREAREAYDELLRAFALRGAQLTQSTWEGDWRTRAEQLVKLATGKSSVEGAAAFLDWREDPAPSDMAEKKRRTNMYRYADGARHVNIRLGSIHSVKGETHDATLVLETFWNGHSLAKLLGWLTGEKCGWKSGPQQKTRLKIHYVAMTRPKRLLCLAMPGKSLGKDPEPVIKQLQLQGWQVKPVQ